VIAEPAELLDRFATLPAATPLLRRLAGWPEDLYLVGGAVRDLMLGGEPADLDLMAPGAVDRLADQLGAAIVRYDRFGTASGELEGHHYDFARARSEIYPRPGALPEVSPAGVQEDLARRDFTVNAIALGVLGPARGQLLAHGCGREDLEGTRLRVLHDRSFRDDPTRLLRLSRYATRLGFAIEPHTLELAEAAIAGGALGTISGDRAGAELRLLASETDPVAALAGLHRLGLDGAIEPGFGLADPEQVRAALALLPADGDPAALVLGAAVTGLPPDARVELLNRLAFAARDRERILDVARAGELARHLARAETASEIAAAVGSGGPEAVALAGAADAREPAGRWLDDLRGRALDISGADLVAAGIAPGPAIGRGLAAALAAQLDDRAPDRATQLAVALRAAAALDSGGG
jgi:tRNA nucleotidyltransferase (CCA-adding enzyme)